jgi:hypothetical protein
MLMELLIVQLAQDNERGFMFHSLSGHSTPPHPQSHLHNLSNQEHAFEADVLSPIIPPCDEDEKYETIIDAMQRRRTSWKIRRFQLICAIVDDSSS